jgi:hypothetical protein
MALADSSLSRACRSIADFLSTGLDGAQNSITLTVGNPHDAAELTSGGHRLNLFFYRVEPEGFGPSPAPDQPWRMRLHCLITAFATEEDNVGAGELDLRLLGETMRLLHEQPVLGPVPVDGETIRLHAIFRPLTIEELNNLWATQSETSLRPSVSYEFALAPIVPVHPAIEGPRVGAIGIAVAPSTAPAAVEPDLSDPDVSPVTVDAARGDWAPHLAWVSGHRAAYALTLPEPAAGGHPTAPVAIAGVPGEPVELRWETWSRSAGWTPGPVVAATAIATHLDPEHADAHVPLQVDVPALQAPAQAALHATRPYQRPDGSTVNVHSILILLTFLEAGP